MDPDEDAPQNSHADAAIQPQPATQERVGRTQGFPEPANSYLEAGALIPILVKQDGGKFSYPSPVLWRQGPPPSREDWSKHWTQWRPRPGNGVAIHLGVANLVLVDLDTKNGHDGPQAYMDRVGDIPDTMMESTPSGGLHLYFQMPPALLGQQQNQITGLWDGVDIKWGNQISVCAPTVRPDGAYVAAGNYAPQELPQALLTSILTRISSVNSEGHRSITEIIAQGSDRGQRDNDLTRLMFWLLHKHGTGAESAEKIRADALDWNQRNCRPPLDTSIIERKLMRLFDRRKAIGDWRVATPVMDPWEATFVAAKPGQEKPCGVKMTVRRPYGRFSELDISAIDFFWEGTWTRLGMQSGVKIDNSYWRRRQAQGWMDECLVRRGACPISVGEIGQVLEAVIEMLTTSEKKARQRVNGNAMVDAELPPEHWLVEGLIQDGVINILVGNGGIGKTTLAIAMCQAVCAGRESSQDDAIVPTTRKNVYYYTAEDEWQDLVSRTRVLAMGRDIGGLTFVDGIQDEWDLFEQIRQSEGDGAGDNFRIIDSVSAVFGNLNDNERVVGFMRALRRAGGTTLLLAHQSKGSLASGRGDPMGGIQWRNQARNVLHISEAEEDKKIINLTVEKHNGSLIQTGEIIALRRNVEWGKSLWYSPAYTSTTRSMISAAIAAGNRRSNELYAFLADKGIKSGTARKEKARMVELGMLVEKDRMLWTRDEFDAQQLLSDE